MQGQGIIGGDAEVNARLFDFNGNNFDGNKMMLAVVRNIAGWKLKEDELRKAREAAESLLTIINDILDISRIEAGKMTLDAGKINLGKIARSAVKVLSVQAQKKGLKLELDIDKDIADNLIGDGAKLKQILVNLIGNAIKFTHSGGVYIRIAPDKYRHTSAGSPNVCLLFSMRDTGIGIPREKLSNIFDMFTQADLSTRKKFGGTGLGLAITKRYVDMMGGIVWVESEEGKGSTFYFTSEFIVDYAAHAAPDNPTGRPDPAGKPDSAGEPNHEEPPCGNIRPLKILLAEDNELNKLFTNDYLTGAGHEVTCVSSGRKVLEKLGQKEFDLILMDVSMPELDGMETTRMIRSSSFGKYNPNIPIVALTAHAMSGDRERFMECGMNGYLVKPLEMNDFDRIAGALTSTPGAGQAIANKPSNVDVKIFDTEYIERRFRDKEDLLKSLLDMYREDAPKRVASLKTALEGGVVDDMIKASHSLKGISATLGIISVSSLCKVIEGAARGGDVTTVRELMPKLEREMHRVIDSL